MYDVVVIGGGAAGLQATLTLGRMHRHVLLVDGGSPRNATVRRMHNFITHDGRSPTEFRDGARAELDSYDLVELCEAQVQRVEQEEDRFSVRIEGGEAVAARRVILATGLRDELPPVPGLEELWGTAVLQCPYCDGHEMSGREVAVLGCGSHAGRLGVIMSQFTDRVTVLADGGAVGQQDADRLGRAGVTVRCEEVASMSAHEDGARVELAGGDTIDAAAVFVSPELSQSAPFAEQLGLKTDDDGFVTIDEVGRTSLEGVYAAGDLARSATTPLQELSVLGAAAAGQRAALICDLDLLTVDTGLPAVPEAPV